MLKTFLALCALLAPLPAAALNVVTDIPPVQSLVAEVMGSTGTPTVLLRPGTSPHDLALRPSDAAALEAADAVFWIGPELSPMLGKAMTTLAARARVVPLLHANGTAQLAMRTGADLTGADAGHTDPHAWLDPANGVAWLGIVADTLASLDPGRAALYQANAVAAKARINAAAAQARATLASDPPSFALAHDEFQYFGHAFGLSAVAALSNSEAQAPGPRRTAEVLDRLAATRPACIVAGPETAPAEIAPLVQAAGAKPLILDILTGGQPDGPGLYPGLITGIAQALATCHR